MHNLHLSQPPDGESFAALIDEARRKGLKKLWGTTDLDNVPMLRLARSLGFSPGRDPREFFLTL